MLFYDESCFLLSSIQNIKTIPADTHSVLTSASWAKFMSHWFHQSDSEFSNP